MPTHDDVVVHRKGGTWLRLAELAREMVAEASQRAGAELSPRLGRGTRLMLALDHRISHDIDLFIRDPQWIAYLTPRLNDTFEGNITGYDEGATSLKFRTPDGEIDFIVGMSLLGMPAERAPETSFDLEPIGEVLAKQLFYRGWALAPRDLFDWYAIAIMRPQDVSAVELANLLTSAHSMAIESALHLMPQSQQARRMWDAILAPSKPDLAETAVWANKQLAEYAALRRPHDQPPASPTPAPSAG
jgi:hypothetical protein